MPNNYNNPFGYAPYQPSYVPPIQPVNRNNYPINNTYAFVNGIEGAKSYQVYPNQSVMLMDSDDSIVYLKQADNTGRATIRTFKLEEVIEKQEPKAPAAEYVSKADFDTLSNKFDALLKKLEGDKDAKSI